MQRQHVWESRVCPRNLEQPLTQRRAAITATLLLIVIVMISLGIFARWLMKADGFIGDFTVLTATLLAYLTVRTKYYYLGALFLILTMCTVTYVVSLPHELGSNAQIYTLTWLVLPLLISPLIFPCRVLCVVTFVPALFLLVFAVLEQPANWLTLMAVLLTGAVVSVAVGYAYNSDLHLISAQNRQLQESNQLLLHAYDETLQGWTKILDMRDSETRGHSERVSALSEQLARELGIDNEDALRSLRYGSLLHDVGKIAIPDLILLKPAALTDDERRLMQRHTEHAYQALKEVEFLRPALDIPRYHHEKWDGTGYNHGLKGTAIPLYARIFFVVDCWDALTSDRPYREAWSREKALSYITEKSGVDFDPRVVEAFLRVIERSGAGLLERDVAGLASAQSAVPHPAKEQRARVERR